jgi:hypothetical protein
MEHKKRRRLEQSRREIRVRTGEEADETVECLHMRSKSRARKGIDGAYRSVCKYCGAPMKRLARKDWVVDTAIAPDAEAGAAA